MLVLIDNHDSYVHNLAQLLRTLGAAVRVVRNDACTPGDIWALRPTGLVLSPGPGSPSQAGVQPQLLRELPVDLPTFGVCLGHQGLLEEAGARIIQDAQPVHGRTSRVRHDGSTLFRGVPSPFEAMRYHSLIVDEPTIRSPWRSTAWTETGVVMACEHASLPRFGVQFHPESFLTPEGARIAANFLAVCSQPWMPKQ